MANRNPWPVSKPGFPRLSRVDPAHIHPFSANELTDMARFDPRTSFLGLLFPVLLAPSLFALLPTPVAADTVAEEAPPYRQGTKTPDGLGKYYHGREIAHTMTWHGIPWLERTERIDEEKPDEVVEALKLRPTDVVADIGAGSGYFTFRMAEKLGEGTVLAVDIQPEMLEFLERRKSELGLDNVKPILGTIEDPSLPENAVDLVLMVDAYHEFSHPWEMMHGIRRALRPGGRVVMVEYRGEDRSIPIKELHKLTQAQARKELEAVGFEWVETLDFLPQQHVLIFRKPISDPGD